jgi:hypothetical protein
MATARTSHRRTFRTAAQRTHAIKHESATAKQIEPSAHGIQDEWRHVQSEASLVIERRGTSFSYTATLDRDFADDGEGPTVLLNVDWKAPDENGTASIMMPRDLEGINAVLDLLSHVVRKSQIAE